MRSRTLLIGAAIIGLLGLFGCSVGLLAIYWYAFTPAEVSTLLVAALGSMAGIAAFIVNECRAHRRQQDVERQRLLEEEQQALYDFTQSEIALEAVKLADYLSLSVLPMLRRNPVDMPEPHFIGDLAVRTCTAEWGNAASCPRLNTMENLERIITSTGHLQGWKKVLRAIIILLVEHVSRLYGQPTAPAERHLDWIFSRLVYPIHDFWRLGSVQNLARARSTQFCVALVAHLR